MPVSEWKEVPDSDKDEALKEARITEPYVRRDNRSREEIIDHLYRGFIGELTYHRHNKSVEWWHQNRLDMRGKSSDAGYDAPNGDNIKTIPKDGKFVAVADDRANRYVVFEYDCILGIRLRGKFFKKDIGNIELPGGTMKRGVYVEQIR